MTMPEYATVQKDGYTVPLIGIPTEAVLDECECCHDRFPLGELTFNGTQNLCGKCTKE